MLTSLLVVLAGLTYIVSIVSITGLYYQCVLMFTCHSHNADSECLAVLTLPSNHAGSAVSGILRA